MPSKTVISIGVDDNPVDTVKAVKEWTDMGSIHIAGFSVREVMVFERSDDKIRIAVNTDLVSDFLTFLAEASGHDFTYRIIPF